MDVLVCPIRCEYLHKHTVGILNLMDTGDEFCVIFMFSTMGRFVGSRNFEEILNFKTGAD
jgi:hypothetical protein